MALIHGGALDQAMKQYGGDIDDWVDLSTGINPHHYPVSDVGISSWKQLPQTSAMQKLITAASGVYGCDEKYILAANGTQILIEKLPHILPKSTIAILSPTYEEHEFNWQKHGHNVVITDDIAVAKKADHLLIVNPNNPTGRLFTCDELQQLRKHFAAKAGFLMIDEAFMDMTPEHSMAQYAGAGGLIILRSFGKFFGLAGVRIGFILAPQSTLVQMGECFGLWGIAGMSMDIASQALTDIEWQQNMRILLADDSERMKTSLAENGFEIIGYTDLFVLVKVPNNRQNAHAYFNKLAQQHILCRKFANDDKILRFGLLKESDLARFNTALKQTCLELGI